MEIKLSPDEALTLARQSNDTKLLASIFMTEDLGCMVESSQNENFSKQDLKELFYYCKEEGYAFNEESILLTALCNRYETFWYFSLQSKYDEVYKASYNQSKQCLESIYNNANEQTMQLIKKLDQYNKELVDNLDIPQKGKDLLYITELIDYIGCYTYGPYPQIDNKEIQKRVYEFSAVKFDDWYISIDYEKKHQWPKIFSDNTYDDSELLDIIENDKIPF